MDATPGCRVVRPGNGYGGAQGLAYGAGISAESAGSTGLCLHTVVIPPGGRASAHLHAHHESAVYVVSGVSEMWWGEQLSHRDVVAAGEFVYIPAGVPHLPVNPSRTDPVTAVVARTDPDEQESVVLLPELDALVPPSG
ncbi:cupin domain-containing protein [Modestobacter sp. URMC 112]